MGGPRLRQGAAHSEVLALRGHQPGTRHLSQRGLGPAPGIRVEHGVAVSAQSDAAQGLPLDRPASSAAARGLQLDILRWWQQQPRRIRGRLLFPACLAETNPGPARRLRSRMATRPCSTADVG